MEEDATDDDVAEKTVSGEWRDGQRNGNNRWKRKGRDKTDRNCRHAEAESEEGVGFGEG